MPANNYKTFEDIKRSSYAKEYFKSNTSLENFNTNIQSNQFRNPQNIQPIRENFTHIPQHNVEHFVHIPHQLAHVKENLTNVTDITEKPVNLHMRFDEEDNYNTASPQVFGPPLWFSLHNASVHYPIKPSPLVQQRMKGVIIGIPTLLPCQNCSEHATAYIEKHYDQLDNICSSKENLFKFFVDFHNNVNERYNKPIMSYEDAYKLYTGSVKISTMTYS